MFSNTGLRHKNASENNQDYLCCASNRRYSVVSLTDGVSSCKRSAKGAKIAGDAITNLFLKKAGFFFDFDKDKIAELAVSHILFELKKQSDKADCDVVEYSSTVACVVHDRKTDKLLCFSLGDSIIIASDDISCRIISMPSDSSCGCVTTTTEYAQRAADVKIIDVGAISSVTICSDGAWRELFSGNRLKPNVSKMFTDNDFCGLKSYLLSKNTVDDSSFISMDLTKIERERTA